MMSAIARQDVPISVSNVSRSQAVPRFVLGVVDEKRRSRAAVSGNDFVIAVAVEVGRDQRVPVVEAGIDHRADQENPPFTLRINHHLVAVPGFDGGQKPPAADFAHADFAGAVVASHFDRPASAVFVTK